MAFKKVHFCIKCEQRLSWDEVMNSHGCCPYCGHLARPAGGTICETKELAINDDGWVRSFLDALGIKYRNGAKDTKPQ